MDMETSGSADSGSPRPSESLMTPDKEKKKFRRNRVACDACHTRRVRCDGSFPCARCVGSRIRCELTRERRKRGRIARKKNVGTVNDVAPPDLIPAAQPPQTLPVAATTIPLPSIHTHSSPSTANDPIPVHPNPPSSVRDRYSISDHRPSPREILGATVSDELPPMTNGFRAPYSYDLLRTESLPGPAVSLPQTLMGNGNGINYEGSRTAHRRRPSQPIGAELPLKYPVLQPLMPCLEPHLPRALVYDLFELYFTSAFSTSMHPACHHIHCYVVRKASLLSPDNPRKTSPALLSSMLWVAALDDRAFALSISPTKRRKICQFLCALTIRLLRPLIHVSFRGEDPIEGITDYASPTAIHEPTAGRTHSFEGGGDDRGLVGPAGSLDDIITYIHVASIISASEQKAASMRW
jgi:arabinolytic transcriptional activator AraR